ncbi:MAG: pyruvate carboxylase subunit B [Planctomycetota bacterium]
MGVKVTDTILRDAHQSLIATRLHTRDMVSVLDKLDRVGYWSLECWGGATFDSCMRFLNENPWERLRTIRKHIKHTRLQMLLRGQNVVGYKHYADDIVQAFVKHAADTGIDVFRIFDALNDVRNLRTAAEAVKKAGKHVEGTISYTTSPVHNIELYVKIAKELQEMGSDTICIKDMAGLLSPYAAYELVQSLKKEVNLPIHLHCHTTSGMAEAAYLKGIEAGAEMIDTAISPLSGGTSQPPTETFVAILSGTEYDTGLDMALLSEIAEHFKTVRKKYSEFESGFTGVDTGVLRYQIPGGMLSNLANQLRDMGARNKMQEVLEEVPRVRAELGYPPLVTPTSQIIGTQAALNVTLGKRYSAVPKETKNLILGHYGKSAAPIDSDIKKKIIGDEKPITGRPADQLAPGLPEAFGKAGSKDIETALCWALFPQVAENFFKPKEDISDLSGKEEIAAIATALLSKFGKFGNSNKVRPLVLPQNYASAWSKAGRVEGMCGGAVRMVPTLKHFVDSNS